MSPYDMTRVEVDRELRRHCGGDPIRIVAWVRSVLLSDDAARELLDSVRRGRLVDNTPIEEGA